MADKQRRPVVVGIGELLWDLLPTGKQLGGAPANFAYHAAALGAASCVVSRVGNDALGQEALDRLDAMQPMSIDRRFVTRDPDHPTGTVDVQLSSSGVADYIIHKDVAWDFLPFTQELAELAGRTDAVCFGTLGQRSPMSRETIGLFLAAVPASCLKVLDINLRQNFYDRRLVHDLLMRSDILKLNESELPTVAALLGLRGEGLEIIQSLMSRYPLKLVALTRGPDGARLQGIGTYSDHPGFAIGEGDLGDTIGAGDAFTAALVMGQLYGRPLHQINEFANRYAAFVCSQTGGMPAVPAEYGRELIRS